MAFKAAAVLAAMAFAAAACTVASAQGKLAGRLVVTGVVPCNTGTLIDVATSPPFPDAKVELRCGGGGAVAGATTSQNGSFAMEADVASAVAAVAGACELVVDTPLARCDARLPAAGRLVSDVQPAPLVGRLLDGALRLAAAGFSFRMA